jgi:hypothetical protein
MENSKRRGKIPHNKYALHTQFKDIKILTDFISIKSVPISSSSHVMLGITNVIKSLICCAIVQISFIFEQQLLKPFTQ